MASSSPFLEPGSHTSANSLAIALLSRDAYAAVTLQHSTGAVDGYAEGAVLNTRFGSFPHSTLLNKTWGSQVRASVVDTGSRGRKRKFESGGTTPVQASQDDEGVAMAGAPPKKAVEASSGFIHILKPTPELWTSSLPHRTQVVYTPDYSYILHRIRARPGTRIIEAGAGSGSFTHASVRAVYDGRSDDAKKGAVFSFEYDEVRCHKMKQEIKEHILEDMVTMRHRNVYEDGFNVEGRSPRANAVFLDLPSPWKALRHLTRRGVQKENGEIEESPLDPNQTVHICTFSPCIEQVKRTMDELRRSGWIDVDMVEIIHRRLNISRDRVGLNYANDRGVTQSPADVAEAVAKLKQVSQKTQDFHKLQSGKTADGEPTDMDIDTEPAAANGKEEEVKSFAQGTLIHRPEAEIKTHTSYLVFAVLPQEWSDEAEEAALAKWPCGGESRTIGHLDKEARKQEKREMLFTKKSKRRKDVAAQKLASQG